MKVFFIDEDIDVEVTVKALQRRSPRDTFQLDYDIPSAMLTLSTKKFDVLVVDLWLPPAEEALPGSKVDMGQAAGLDLIEWIKKSDKSLNRETPILVFSGVVPRENPRVQSFRDEYRQWYIKKPIHPDRLAELIRKAEKEGAI